MRLMPVKEADKLIREHVETTHFVDASGNPYEPTTMPPDPSPDPDEDDE
jgi:hypothetical protein